MLSIDEIRTVIRSRRHEPAPFEPGSGQAAVAMILSDGDDGLDVCFIRRAECEGDPWSGQVAFPGGRADPTDPDVQAAAERETWEEIGLRLETGHRVGPLPVQPISPRAPGSTATLSPFVYYLGSEGRAAATIRLNYEVETVFWVPMVHLFDEGATTELEYPIEGAPIAFPGIRYEEHVIWGLTLRVLQSFAAVMRRTLPV